VQDGHGQQPGGHEQMSPPPRREPRGKSLAIGLAATLFVLVLGITAFELAGVTSFFGRGQPQTAGLPSPSLSGLTSPSAIATQALPTPAASASSSPATSPTAATAFRRDSFVEVVTSDLRVRSKPGVGADSVKLEPLLWKGAVAFVIRGPVKASGYDWYLVEPLGEADVQYHATPPRLGWVAAAGKDGEPWLATRPVTCNPNPLDSLQYDVDWPPSNMVALGCHGNKPVTFMAGIGGRQHPCELMPPWVMRPLRFDPCEPRYVLADERPHDYTEVRTLSVVIDPSVAIPRRVSSLRTGEFLIVDVTGQYDNAAARTCRAQARPGGEGPPPPRDLAIRTCRSEFVVTSLSVHVDS
jgi:hypothetical protein